MPKQIFTNQQLAKFSASEIIDHLIYHNYSLLKTLGAERMRLNMVPIGKVCHFVSAYFYKTTGPKNNEEEHIKNAQRKILRKLQFMAPARYNASKFPKQLQNGLVIGFNHPSLGEILRLVALKFDLMGEKPMLFPVNLPWYEAIAPDYEILKKLGVIITPTITPATWQKLHLKEHTSLYQSAFKLKRDFRELYTELSYQTIQAGGIIFVAPSATRQATVFKSQAVYEKTTEIIPTMSILALKLLKDSETQCDFLPLAILPPKKSTRGLNLFKTYQLRPAPLITSRQIRQRYFKNSNLKRLDNFDYDFHLQIAQQLPKKFWY